MVLCGPAMKGFKHMMSMQIATAAAAAAAAASGGGRRRMVHVDEADGHRVPQRRHCAAGAASADER